MEHAPARGIQVKKLQVENDTAKYQNGMCVLELSCEESTTPRAGKNNQSGRQVGKQLSKQKLSLLGKPLGNT